MRIVYYSYWGTYAAYTMAALHTGIYREDSMPPEKWIAAQYELCRRYGEQTGNMIYVGLDSQLRDVYSLGCRQHAKMVIRALQHIGNIFNIQEPVHFLTAENHEGYLPGLLQRMRFSDKRLTEKLFEIWFRKKYSACLQEVQRNKQALKDGII